MLKNKSGVKVFLHLLAWLSLCYLDPLEAKLFDKKQEEPIFISLGSHCEVSQQLILNNLRSAAFPFD